jgi:hypothetical protein
VQVLSGTTARLGCGKTADHSLQDEYSILNSKHFIGIHGYMIVYSVANKQSFEMARIIRDKILNHLVSHTHHDDKVATNPSV